MFYGNWSYSTYRADGQRVRRKVNGKDPWQIYGIEGELVAEYDANAATNSAQLKEYGYRNGQLLVTVDQVNRFGQTRDTIKRASPTTPASKPVNGTNGSLWDGYASATTDSAPNAEGNQVLTWDDFSSIIDPWSKGGHTTLTNADLMCRRYNSKKGNGFPRFKRKAA